MRVLITGSRQWKPETLVPRIIAAFAAFDVNIHRLTIITGGAKGADEAAAMVAERLGANLYTFPAEWDYYRSLGRPKAAGVLRNAEMLNTIPPDLVLAWPLPSSKGTWDMVNLAHKRGFRVEVMTPDQGVPRSHPLRGDVQA